MSFNADALAAEIREWLTLIRSGSEPPQASAQRLKQWAVEQAMHTKDSMGISQHAVITTANALIEYVTGADPETYFFTQDNASHWYMIPVSLRSKWNSLTRVESDENDSLIEITFSKYRTGGSIGNITFKVVSK